VGVAVGRGVGVGGGVGVTVGTLVAVGAGRGVAVGCGVESGIGEEAGVADGDTREGLAVGKGEASACGVSALIGVAVAEVAVGVETPESPPHPVTRKMLPITMSQRRKVTTRVYRRKRVAGRCPGKR
jgi:hypothetical protein